MTTNRSSRTAWWWWVIAIVVVGAVVWWIAEANDPDYAGLQSEVVTLREGYTRLDAEFAGFREEWGAFREEWDAMRGADGAAVTEPEGAVEDVNDGEADADDQ